MQSRDASDLQETRDQIKLCFQDISCYGLPHPGFAVTKKSYKGEVEKIETHFLELLGRYCPRVFDNLAAKVIHGRELTGKELTVYIEKYAEMFASGASFPEASTMLEATASANNTNAVNAAIKKYEEHMEKIAGHKCSNFVQEEKLKEDHLHHKEEAFEVFESIANFGSKKSIDKSKKNLEDMVEESFAKYRYMNEARKPNWGPEL
jgi:atlastin